MSRLHPATVVTIAACGWLLTLALNTPVASASVMLVALACGTVSTRNASVILTTIALSVPAALSMLVIHAPYGDTPVAPLLTADGLILAGSLSLRFCALMACFIAAMAALRIADIAKWLQVSRVGHKVAYVVGSSLQTLPQGAHAWRCVREANQLAGITITWRNTISRVIIP
ncbi:ABC transporter permease, partial [Corynebacterium sp.]